MLEKIRNNKYRISISAILLFIYAITALYPFIFNIIVSLTNYNLVSDLNFIGLKNFKILFNDTFFIAALKNNSIFLVVSIVVSIPIALTLAYMIHNSGRFMRKIYTPIYFLPNVTSLVALSLVWKLLYLPKLGIFARVLEFLHIPSPAFLLDAKTALGSVIFFSIWKSLGFDIVIFIAGINEIPKSIFDSAQIDGVTPASRFFKIIFPLLRPQILFLIALKSIGSLLVFEQIYMLMEPIDGPRNSTTTFMTYLYTNAFRQLNFGYATAIAVVVTIVLIGLVIFQLNVFKTEYEY